MYRLALCPLGAIDISIQGMVTAVVYIGVLGLVVWLLLVNFH
jgi:hypothetical protein